jgi:hypothetical protein
MWLFISTIPPPGVANRAVDWAMRTPNDPGIVVGNPNFIGPDMPTSQTQSAEDWWYDTKPIYESGVHTGYIVCGYTTYLNMQFDESSKTPKGFVTPYTGGNLEINTCNRRLVNGNDISGYKQTISRYDLDGKLVWCKPQNHSGPLYSIIQTADGGFLAIGETRGAYNKNDAFYKYNPSSLLTPDLNTFIHPAGTNGIDPNGYRRDKTCLVKVDIDGNLQWTYLYGSDEMISGDLAGNSLKLSTLGSSGLDLDFNGTTGYTLLCRESLPSGRAFVLNVDLNGFVIPGTKKFYQHLDQIENTPLVMWARAMDCENGQCVISGGYYPLGTQTDERGFLIKIDQATNNLSTDWIAKPIKYAGAPGGNNKALFQDVVLNNDGTTVVALAQNKTGCFFNDNNVAIGALTKWNANGTLAISTSLGEMRAYDFKIGLTKTSSNGYAIVSTKRALKPDGTPDPVDVSLAPYPAILQNLGDQTGYYNCATSFFSNIPVWNTDTYVAKLDANLVKLWDTQFDSDDAEPANHPADFKEQECLYRICEGNDGSLFVVGNTSHNNDDYFAAKIYSDCQRNASYNTFDNSDNTIDITSNTTWNSSKTVKGKVTIKSGATLTISNTTVEFADSRRIGIRTGIVIETGGRLIVNNATLTSYQACDKAVWDGIEVQGNPALRQSPTTNQGYVELNNSIVNNALNAISTRALLTDNINVNWLKTGGGIVKTQNTTFTNNKRAFEFMAYLSSNVFGAPLNDASSISKCNFFTTNDFGNGGSLKDPSPQITMWKTRNIVLTGNKFTNQRLGVAADKRGIAISAIDAAFRVDQTCSGPATTSNPCPGPNVKSEFNDLFAGVIVTSGAGNATFSVKNALFNNNLYGVRVGGAHFGTITNNTFNIPNAKFSGLTKYAFGVHMDGAFGCTVEDNAFFDNGNILPNSLAGPANMGVFVANADFAGGGMKHYRNDFTNIDISTQVAGQNTTLQVDCNRFYHPNGANFTDISVPVGVLATQGDCGLLGNNNPILPQANEFSGACNGTSRKQVQSAVPSIWEYKSYPANQLGISIPCFIGSTQYTNCSGQSFDRFLACPQSSVTIIGASGLITSNAQSKNAVLNLVDGGNTTLVLATIAAASNGNSLRNQLAPYAPYLSNEALLAVIDKNIAPGQKKQILEANAPFTTTVRTKIEQSSLPNGHKNQLLSLVGESTLTTLANTAAAYDREQALNNNDLVRLYLEENNVSAAYDYLKQIGNTQALCAMIPVNLSRDTSGTVGLIDSLRNMATIIAPSDPATAERMTDFCSLYATLLKLESRTGGLFTIPTAEKNSLLALAIKQPAFAPTIYGRLYFLEDNYAFVDAYELDGTKSMQIQNNKPNAEAVFSARPNTNYDYSLYPNPATTLLNFDFGLGYETEKTVVIYSLSGEKMGTYTSVEDVFEIDLSTFNKGLYLINVVFTQEEKTVLTKRLSIQH